MHGFGANSSSFINELCCAIKAYEYLTRGCVLIGCNDGLKLIRKESVLFIEEVYDIRGEVKWDRYGDDVWKFIFDAYFKLKQYFGEDTKLALREMCMCGYWHVIIIVPTRLSVNDALGRMSVFDAWCSNARRYGLEVIVDTEYI